MDDAGVFVEAVDSVDVSGICEYVGVETLAWLVRGAEIVKQSVVSCPDEVGVLYCTFYMSPVS